MLGARNRRDDGFGGGKLGLGHQSENHAPIELGSNRVADIRIAIAENDWSERALEVYVFMTVDIPDMATSGVAGKNRVAFVGEGRRALASGLRPARYELIQSLPFCEGVGVTSIPGDGRRATFVR